MLTLFSGESLYEIDNLVTIDPVPFGRELLRGQVITPLELGGNVKQGLNLYASLGTFWALSGDLPHVSAVAIPAKLHNGKPGFVTHPDYPDLGKGLYLDGVDYIKGPKNEVILYASGQLADHQTIMNAGFYEEDENGQRRSIVNMFTKGRITTFLTGKSTRY